MDELKHASSQTKSIPVKVAIEAALEAAGVLDDNRKALHSAFRETKKVARSLSKPTNDHLFTSLAYQETILSICKDLRTSINRQQQDINALKNDLNRTQPTYAQMAKDRRPTTDLQDDLQGSASPYTGPD